MNEELKKFITGIGVMCEIWTIAYHAFLKQGFNQKEAMTHTQALVSALLSNQFDSDKGEGE